MSERILNMERYERRAQFDYFRSLAYPYVGVTVEVDVTDYLARLNAVGYPFFLSFCRSVTRAANAVPQLRQRVRDEGIVEYDVCPGSVTLALPDGSYCYCTLPERETLAEYLPAAEEAGALALRAGSIEDGEDGDSLLFLSSLPWLRFSSLVQPVPEPADSNPRIIWGKCYEQARRTLVPVALRCNHALVDGRHLADFYEALDRELSADF